LFEICIKADLIEKEKAEKTYVNGGHERRNGDEKREI